MTVTEQMRHEWRDFQVWYTAMKDEETKSQRQDVDSANTTERNKPRRWFSNAVLATPEERRIWRKALVEGRVTSRAQAEWQRRLDKAGLKMEQWTDITVPENSAVSAALWGGSVTEDFAASDSFDETETDIESESVTSTLSTSSRGSPLWTPPDIARAAELPLAIMHPTPGGRTAVVDKKPTAPRGPPNARVNVIPSMQFSKVPDREEWLIRDEPSQSSGGPHSGGATAEARLKGYARPVPMSIEDWGSSKSMLNDGVTLLATSNEFHNVEQEERESAVPEEIPSYSRWHPARQSALKADVTNQRNTTIQSNIPPQTNTLNQPPVLVQTRAPNKSHKPKAPIKTHSSSNTSIQLSAVTSPPTHSSGIAPSVQKSQAERESALQKRIEEIFKPLVIDIKEQWQKKVTEAQADEASCDKFTKEYNDALKSIRRIVDDLCRDHAEQERQHLHRMDVTSVEHGGRLDVAKQQTVMLEEFEFSPKAHSSRFEPDRSPRAVDATKPPSPLTPPQTPQPGTRYIGPTLTEEEMREEATAFDNFTLVARKQKIREFHKVAETMELELAEQFHAKNYDKKTTLEILKQHELAMEGLRKVKEQERKDMCVAERDRRRTEIGARARHKTADQHVPVNQAEHSSSFQQKPREDQMATQPRWRSAKAGTSSENNRGQTAAGPAANTENLDDTSRQDSSVRHRRTEKPGGFAGLFFMDPADRKVAAVDEANLSPNHVDRIPSTSLVLLPELYSDIDDEESITPNPVVKGHRRVHFTPSVRGNDSDTDSSDTGRTFSNGLEFGTGPGPGIRGKGATSRRFSIQENTSGRPMIRKTAVVGPKQTKGEKSTEIWYPPADKEGKGKEKEVLPDHSPVQSQQEPWRSWV